MYVIALYFGSETLDRLRHAHPMPSSAVLTPAMDLFISTIGEKQINATIDPNYTVTYYTEQSPGCWVARGIVGSITPRKVVVQ